LTEKAEMKLLKKPLNEETYDSLLILAVILAVLLVSFLINQVLKLSSESIVKVKQEKKVIVQEANSKEVPVKIPPKALFDSVRDAVSQGNYSTAYIQLNKSPKESPEYEELSRLIAAEKQKKQRPGIRKEASTTQNPLRYFDEATPRNREADWLYVYFSDIAGALWPRFCIQSVAKRPLNITAFRITADGKTFEIKAPAIKSEKILGNVAEWYDVPIDHQSYSLIQALIQAHKSKIVYIGSKGTIERAITEDEKKGLRRIMEAYTALGGSFAFILPEVTQKTAPGNKH
jgi:hypothetical protein